MKLVAASIVFVVGLAAVAAGAWLIAPAAGLIVAGALAAGTAVVWAAGDGEEA